MTDRPSFDTLERLISAQLERYVAGAVDPRSASDIADAAMRPRGAALGARVRRNRRLLYFAIAAVLLVPAAYIGATLLRPPAPDLLNVAPSPPPQTPSPAPTQGEPSPAPLEDLAIFVRRVEGSRAGLDVYAVRPDGAELPLRHLPDSIAPDGGTLEQWASASESGWLALAVTGLGQRWPMVLVDLRDPESTPWLVEQASLGGIGPSWGPNGQVAALLHNGDGSLVIADPETRTTRILTMQTRDLVGGGPSIIWSADGSGIIGSNGDGTYDTVPIDGSDPAAGVGRIFGHRGGFGEGLATLRICLPDEGCPDAADGRVERAELEGPATTIWQQEGADRALDASFGNRPDEYWLAVDADGGRQFDLVHVEGERKERVARVNRDANWQYVGAPSVSPDQQSLVSWIDIGGEPAAVVVGPSGSQTYHTGMFAGFIDNASFATLSAADFGPPNETMPPVGVGYQLPTLEDLIEAEVQLNPGRIVLGSDSYDAVEGETSVQIHRIPAEAYENAEAYLDCLGPSPVTVTIGSNSTTSPCLRAGSYIQYGAVSATDPVVVEASGDTSWRVVVYGMEQSPDSTPPPVPNPSVP